MFAIKPNKYVCTGDGTHWGEELSLTPMCSRGRVSFCVLEPPRLGAGEEGAPYSQAGDRASKQNIRCPDDQFPSFRSALLLSVLVLWCGCHC